MFGTSLLPFLFMINKWKKNYSTRVKIEYNQEKKKIHIDFNSIKCVLRPLQNLKVNEM